MAGTTIMACGCSNLQQDNIHGLGRRVFNKMGDKTPPEFRCTVCGTVKSKGGGEATKIGKKGKK